MELENFENLVNLTVTTEKWFLLHELSKDASYSPDIDSKTVLLLSEQDFGCSVPEGLDLMREGFDRETESTSKAEVCDFESACSVNE